MKQSDPNAPDPHVTLVVLNWNGKELLDSCFGSLVGQDYTHFDIILVDNASDDGSADLIRSSYPSVRVIANDQNLGFTRGTNIGLRAAFEGGADIIIALNNDVSAPAGWLSALVAAMIDDPQIGIAGCKLLYPDGRTIQHAGAEIVRPLAYHHHQFQFEPDRGQADQAREVDYVTGAAIAIRRLVVEAIGFLDEDFGPFYYEEVDYCYRARAAGWRVVVVPQAAAIHHESYSVGQIGLQHQAYVQRNRLLFISKHYTKDYFVDQYLPAELDAIQQESSYYTLTLILAAAHSQQQRWEPVESQRYLADGFGRIAAAAAQARQRLVPLTVTPPPTLQVWDFASDVPLVGPLITRFRRAWHQIAARWYTDHAVRQIYDIYLEVAAQSQQQLEIIQGLRYEISRLEKEIRQLKSSLIEEHPDDES